MKRTFRYSSSYLIPLLILILLFCSPLKAKPNESESLPPQPSFYTYDVESLNQVNKDDPKEIRRVWDQTALVSALQGLVNRQEPRLFLFFVQNSNRNVDRYWLQIFSHEITSPSGTVKKGWLQNYSQIMITSLDELLEIFRDEIEGIVVYDERVPSTFNVALTIAGVENLLPVRYDPEPSSLYRKLVDDPSGPCLPVVKRLINEDGSILFTGKGMIPDLNIPSTGSSKADAYYWMIENYIKKGLVNPLEGGYYLDAYWLYQPKGAVQNHCLTNRDFVISRRGFFFDLSPWEDETPNDDLNQPLGTDFMIFNEILKSVYQQTDGKNVVRISGFTPWDTKYTNAATKECSHEPVATEWRHAELLSNYNCFMDADALGLGAMANASFYQHFPLENRYLQHKPTLESLRRKEYLDAFDRPKDKTFVSLYIGDYDSSAWVYQMIPNFWDDPNRGKIPITWAINPNIADRFAPGLDYLRFTQSELDFFVSGDSGAGYINPMGFVEPRNYSQKPDKLDVWIRHCSKYFQQWDLSGIGFIIDGSSSTTDRATLSRLAEVACDGMVTHRGSKMGVVTSPSNNPVPYRPMNSDLLNVSHGVNVILGDVRHNMGSQFNVYRTILWSPTQIRELMEHVKRNPNSGSRVEFVDMYTFWLLLEQEISQLHAEEVDIRL